MLDVCLTVSAENHFRPSGGWLRVMRVIRVHGHILQFVQCAIVLLVIPCACHALCLYIFYRVFKSRKSFSFPASCPDFHHIVLYNIVYWKPTSIQIMENIPLTSRVDIRILLKERASQETDFSPAIPCYHTRFQEHTWMWEAPWAPSRNIDKALKRRASA